MRNLHLYVTRNTPALFAGVFFVLSTLLSIQAQETDTDNSNLVRYTADETAATVKVDGDSSLHAWSVEGNRAQGNATIQNGPPESLVRGNQLSFTYKEGQVRFPVKTIKGEKEGLNEKMYKALDAENHPYISYEPNRMQLQNKTGSKQVRVETTGDLSVAGVPRTVTLEMDVKQVAPGRLVSTGETDLKMTDFDIKPPSALGGIVTAYDKVTVSWKFPVVKQSVPSYQAGSMFRDANQVLFKRYTRARDALADGKTSRADRYLKQMKRLIDRIDLSITDLGSDEQKKVQKLVDQLDRRVDQTIEAADAAAKRTELRQVSTGFAALLKATGHALDGPVRVMQCAGADVSRWLARDEGTKCPYTVNGGDGHEDHAVQFLMGSTQG